MHALGILEAHKMFARFIRLVAAANCGLSILFAVERYLVRTNVHGLRVHSSGLGGWVVSSWRLLCTMVLHTFLAERFALLLFEESEAQGGKDSEERHPGPAPGFERPVTRHSTPPPFSSSLCPKPSKAMDTASKVDEFSSFQSFIVKQSSGHRE